MHCDIIDINRWCCQRNFPKWTKPGQTELCPGHGTPCINSGTVLANPGRLPTLIERGRNDEDENNLEAKQLDNVKNIAVHIYY